MFFPFCILSFSNSIIATFATMNIEIQIIVPLVSLLVNNFDGCSFGIFNIEYLNRLCKLILQMILTKE